MKSMASHLVLLLRNRPSRRNLLLLVRFLLLLFALVALYSVLFHYIMAYEGEDHSWLTGFYWTLTVMSTLGFGDITFNSDLGRTFSIIVLLSGILLLLVLLPFTFIQFLYIPWMEAQSAARAPRELPVSTRDHVILTHYDAVTAGLIARLKQYQFQYVLLVPDLQEALRLHDQRVRVMVGELDSPETYRLSRTDQAALVATTAPDHVNTNVAFTVREVAPKTPILATADLATSAPILQLAGCDQVIQLSEIMGESLARRTIGGDAVSHVIGSLESLLIAEANVSRTPLVGRTLAENRLTDLGVSVVGVWDRGQFQVPRPETVINPNAVLVLAGSREQLDAYDEAFAIYNVSGEPVVLVGAGKVGRATARALERRGIPVKIIERRPEAVTGDNFVVGDAADPAILEQAGFDRAPAVLITSHDDAVNTYLTILLRNLRPDIQIISRAMVERNVSTLHRAGADFVISMASMGVGMVMNQLQHASILTVAEGLNIVRLATPASLVGRTLAETPIRAETGATVIAIVENGQMRINPDPRHPIPADSAMILIGTMESEERFLDRFGSGNARQRHRSRATDLLFGRP